MEPSRQWPMGAAWAAVVQVTAAAYGVDGGLLLAESRGRGPRPPERAREPKKVAIYLLLLLTDADCAAVARHLKLHKDTVASHCAEVRGWADDDVVEQNLQLLAATASVTLGLCEATATGAPKTSRACALGRAAA